MTTLNVFIPARQLSVGDYIIGQGEVTTVGKTVHGKVFARVGKAGLIFDPEERVEVSLEDDGDGS